MIFESSSLVAAFEHDPDAVALLDEDLRYVFANAKAATWSGCDAAAMLGRSLWDLFPTMRGTRFESELRRAAETRQAVHFEHAASTRSGNRYEMFVIPVDKGFLFRARNVTELRRAEALGAAQERVLDIMGRGAPIEELLGELARTIEALSSYDGLCAVMLVDAASGRLRCAAAPSLPPAFVRALGSVPIDAGSLSSGAAAAARERVVTGDLESDARWESVRATARAHGLRACWATPIIASTGAVLGTFDVYYREALEPGPADLRLVDDRIHLAAVAIERARATETLERSERRFRTLFAQWPAGILLYDRDLRVTDCNDAFTRMLQVKRELLLGASLEAAIDARPLAALRASLDGRASSYDGPYESMQRGKLWLSLRATPLLDAEGRIAGGMATLADLTELREAEDAVRSGAQTLARARKIAGIGSWEYSARTGRTTWSDEMYRMFGYEPGSVEADVDAWLPLVHPEDRPRVEASLESQRKELREYELEMRLAMPNGELRFVEIRGEVIIDADGARRILGTMKDVTERERAEAERRRAEELLRAVVESSPLAIITTGVDGRVTTWNAAATRIFGYAPEEILGQSFLTYVPPEGLAQAQAQEAMQLVYGKGYAGQLEAKRLRKNGEAFDAQYSIAPLRDARGAYCGAVAIVDDRTEHKRLSEELRQAQKMEAMGRLAGGVAHDFNNLLTVIVTSVEMMLEEPTSERIRQDLHVVQTTADRAASLTRQLLTFSRRQVVQPRAIDLNQLVSEMEQMIRRVIREDIALVVTANRVDGAARGAVMADRGQLEQVLMNLAVNARDAMPQGGTLSITVEDDADANQVVLAVRDTGVGMDASTLTRIFEPFFTTKEQGRGTGLGLSTVYGIVQQSGGRVVAESAPGKGTRFVIRLPRVDSSSIAPAASSGRLQAARGVETILLVEDEDLVRRIVRDVLTRSGYRVLEAANGEDALALCMRNEEAIDLVLTDVVMPRMSGRDLVERVLELSPSTRFLYMSGYADDVLGEGGRLSSDTPFLPKPFTPEILTRKVREVLRHASRRKGPPS